jgi:hypothetical protein
MRRSHAHRLRPAVIQIGFALAPWAIALAAIGVIALLAIHLIRG